MCDVIIPRFQVRLTPGALHLSFRLKRLWDFIRLQLHLHFEVESGTADHCLRLHLGSLAEPRYNTPCTHKHPQPRVHVEAPPCDIQQPRSGPPVGKQKVRHTLGVFLGSQNRINLSSTCKKYRNDWSQEWEESLWHGVPAPPKCSSRSSVCAESACKKRSKLHCVHCDKSLCRAHCQQEICSAEFLPSGLGDEFVCASCSPGVEACKHSTGECATCAEMHYFKEDLMHCAKACKDDQILGRAKDLCKSIDIMVGHTARTKNQERFWPDLLDNLRKHKEYDHVLLKSDYWKKFEGTVMKQGSDYVCVCHEPKCIQHQPKHHIQKSASRTRNNQSRLTVRGT